MAEGGMDGLRVPTAMPINIKDLYDQAIRTIRCNIGIKWPELARALQFNNTDIDAIKVGQDRDDLNGQIYEMIRQWEQRHDHGKGTVYKLLCGLHKAVNSTGDPRIKEIRDRIFTDVVQALCDESFHDKWKTIAELVGFQVDEIDECLSASSRNKKAQSIAFLKKWSQRDGLNMIKRIPLALADEKLYWIKKAEHITSEVFGMSLDRFKCTMQPQLAASCGEFGIDRLSLVELKHKGIIFRGVVRWIGRLPHLLPDMIMAGIELEMEYDTLKHLTCNGTLHGTRYFNCEDGLGMFVPIEDVTLDTRFTDSPQTKKKPEMNHSFHLTLDNDPPSTLQNTPTPQQETHSLPASFSQHDRGLSRSTSTPMTPPLPTPPHPAARRTSSGGHSGSVSNGIRREWFCYQFPADAAGILIGKNGQNKKRIEEETETQIKIQHRSGSLNDTLVKVYGTEEQSDDVAKRMTDLVVAKTKELLST